MRNTIVNIGAILIILAFFFLGAAILSLGGCDDRRHDPVEVNRSKMRTDGWLEGDGWVETERRVVGSKVYIKNETATEIRWVEVQDHGLGRSRVMRRDERVPQ